MKVKHDEIQNVFIVHPDAPPELEVVEPVERVEAVEPPELTEISSYGGGCMMFSAAPTKYWRVTFNETSTVLCYVGFNG